MEKFEYAIAAVTYRHIEQTVEGDLYQMVFKLTTYTKRW